VAGAAGRTGRAILPVSRRPAVTYDAVVFDMDGVLLTGYHTPREVYREAVRETLVSMGHDGEIPEAIVDPEDVAAFRRACERLGVDPKAVWAGRERGADERETDLIVDGERTLFDDVDALADLAVPLAIVSNNRHRTVEFVVEHFGLPAATACGRDPTIEGYERRKPDPHYLTDVVEGLGVAPERVLFVGDRRSDVQTAHNAGTAAALLARGGDPPPGEPAPAHHISTLRALPELV